MVRKSTIERFQNKVWDFYRAHGRSFPWRKTTNPYHIFVSEFMLQQTTTDRVEKYYEPFLWEFPCVRILAQASRVRVYRAWSGLGYNRRALYLHQSAQKIVMEFGGNIPPQEEVLLRLPGVGASTAGAICAFAFNLPTVFLETNICAVILHEFFSIRERGEVTEKDVRAIVAATLDSHRPRLWYWALMDYGSYLKKKYRNQSLRLRGYKSPKPFEGSLRQLRGLIMKEVSFSGGPVSLNDLLHRLGRRYGRRRVYTAVNSLAQDRLIFCTKKTIFVSKD